MSDTLMRLYHSLPASVRPVAATLRGLYLGWWRYGLATERIGREAQAREQWTRERWSAYQDERLAYVLHRAATRVPYYSELWQARRRRGDRSAWDLLANWPILEKDVLREQAERFIADDRDPRRMFFQQTSGTTGKPIRLWRSRRTLQNLYGIGEARTRRWVGVAERERWARLGGQLVTPVEQRQPPFWVWNAALRQLYLSTYHLAPDLLPHYLDALRDYQIVCIQGYPSSLHVLAQAALQLGRRDLSIRAVITSAEPLMQHQRETIAAAFQCAVQETYGMGETVAAATRCSAGRLHQWPEIGIVEVLDGTDPVAPGVTGEFVCTGLLEADMPLIRYRVGDRGSLPVEQSPCPCGRSLPELGHVEGRSNDMLLTPDGRRVFWLNPVFYGVPVREAQIVQETIDRIRVRFAPAPEFTDEWGREITGRIRARLGEVQVVLEPLEQVPRSANGKLQAVRCDLDPEERERVLARRS